ncbi:MAG TPA: hypothetical protein VHG69_11690, partial [Thermoleophilaceae bacterium]|nr:hypothetical protein [Thermoleophilaceae bacterium]
MAGTVRTRLVWLAAIPLVAWGLTLVLAPRLRYAGVGIDDMGWAWVTASGLLACLVIALVTGLATRQVRSRMA